MGHTIWYQLHRREPLSLDETRALVEHVRRHRADAWTEPYDLSLAPAGQPDDCVAVGHQKTAYDEAEIERLLEVLDELRVTVAGTRCYVSDDLGMVGWNAAQACFELGAPPVSGATTLARTDAWPRASARLQPPVLAPDGSDIDALVTAMDQHDQYYSDLEKGWRAAAMALDPLVVARSGLARYRPKPKDSARTVLYGAMSQLVDTAPLRDAVLAVWHAAPTYGHYFSDFGQYLALAMRGDPVLRAQLARELASEPGSEDPAERARREALVRASGESRCRDLAPAMATRMRADRERPSEPVYGQPGAWIPWRSAAIAALGALGEPAAWPTVMLECAAHHRDVFDEGVRAMVALAPDRIGTFLPRLVAAELRLLALIEAVVGVQSPVVDAVLAGVVEHEEPRVRCAAIAALVQRGAAAGVDAWIDYLEASHEAEALDRGRAVITALVARGLARDVAVDPTACAAWRATHASDFHGRAKQLRPQRIDARAVATGGLVLTQAERVAFEREEREWLAAAETGRSSTSP